MIEKLVDSSGSLVGSRSTDAPLLKTDLVKLADKLERDRPDQRLAVDAIRQLSEAAQNVSKPIEERQAQALKAIESLGEKTSKVVLSAPIDGTSLGNRIQSATDLVDKLEEDLEKLPPEAIDSLKKVKDQAVKAVEDELQTINDDLNTMVAKGDFEKAMDGALSAAKVASRLASDIAHWGDMNDMQKLKSIVSNLAGILEAAQPFVAVAVAEFKLPIMVALMIIADLIDFGGGGEGGNDHDKDNDKNQEDKSSKEPGDPQKPTKPGQSGPGGGGDDPAPDSKPNPEQESAAGDAVNEAVDEVKKDASGSGLSPKGLAEKVARKQGLDPKQTQALTDKFLESFQAKMGPDRKIKDPEGLYKALIAATVEVTGNLRGLSYGKEDEDRPNSGRRQPARHP